MSTTTGKKSAASNKTRAAVGSRSASYRPSRNMLIGVVVVLGALFAVFWFSNSGSGSGHGSGAGAYKYQVGQPGPGTKAPAVQLAATDGSRFDLATQRGKTVLLYFQEGVGCEPCWTQITDIEKHRNQFARLGIDTIVSITTNPRDALAQKVADTGITIPVLSDSQLATSSAYNANRYGMMGNATDGHRFVLVGPDGTIRWRADYGGAPDYTRYVPVPNLLADLRKGMAKAGAS